MVSMIVVSVGALNLESVPHGFSVGILAVVVFCVFYFFFGHAGAPRSSGTLRRLWCTYPSVFLLRL